jgi:hypothetical protein
VILPKGFEWKLVIDDVGYLSPCLIDICFSQVGDLAGEFEVQQIESLQTKLAAVDRDVGESLWAIADLSEYGIPVISQSSIGVRVAGFKIAKANVIDIYPKIPKIHYGPNLLTGSTPDK